MLSGMMIRLERRSESEFLLAMSRRHQRGVDEISQRRAVSNCGLVVDVHDELKGGDGGEEQSLARGDHRRLAPSAAPTHLSRCLQPSSLLPRILSPQQSSFPKTQTFNCSKTLFLSRWSSSPLGQAGLQQAMTEFAAPSNHGGDGDSDWDITYNPTSIYLSSLSLFLTTMSEAKFNKAAEIIQSLPKDGPIKPTQDDQLFVSQFAHLNEIYAMTVQLVVHIVLQSFQARSARLKSTVYANAN